MDWERDLRPTYRGELISDLEDKEKIDLELPELKLISDVELQKKIKTLIIKGHLRFYSRAFNPALFFYRQAANLLDETQDNHSIRLNVNVYLADTYLELFQFEPAKKELLEVQKSNLKDNRPISPRVLWLKMAKTWLAAGDAIYRGTVGTIASNQKELIKFEYEQILEDGLNPNFDSPLYSSSLEFMASDVEGVVLAIQEEDILRLNKSHPQMVELICKCQQRFRQLEQNANFIGFSNTYVPILRFEYLQDVARRFSQIAAQANREYVGYMQKAQQESFTFRQIQQAVELNQAGLGIEEQALNTAKEEVNTAETSQDLAEFRWDQARNYANEYSNTGRELVLLDQAISWANASTIPEDQIQQSVETLESIGISKQYKPRNKQISDLTKARATRNYSLQVEQLNLRVRELAESRNLSKEQLKIALSRQETANLRYRAAQFRLRHSEANLEEIKKREFGLEFFSEIARLVRETAQIYLEHATLLAYMMQQAFNLEFGENLNRIRFDYGDLDNAQGLYSADLLLRDIDFFTFQKAAQIRNKVQPIITEINLIKEYPLEFLRLLRDGQMLFSTKLDYFHQRFPGIYNARIINVTFLVSSGQNIIGSITANGVSYFRDERGNKHSKMHASETMIISSLRAKRNTIFPQLNEQLDIFENIGLETDWLLYFPKDENLFDVKSIDSLKMYLSFYCEVNSNLAEEDLRSIPKEGEAETYINFRNDLTDSFYDLEESAKHIFLVNQELFPHKNPRIRSLRLIALDNNENFTKLKVRLWSKEYGSDEILYVSNDNGIVLIQAEDQENNFYDKPLITEWSIELRPEDNPDLASIDENSNQLDLSNINNIFFAVKYFYKLT